MVLKYKPNNRIIFRHNVENLFTTVLVLETIDVIIYTIYHHSILSSRLKINSNDLCKILLLYTIEVPYFFYPYGNIHIYIQKEGIGMRSVLGPVFSDF